MFNLTIKEMAFKMLALSLLHWQIPMLDKV